MDNSCRSTVRRHVRTALRAIDAGVALATREQNRTLKQALLEAREPLAAYLALDLGAPARLHAPGLRRRCPAAEVAGRPVPTA